MEIVKLKPITSKIKSKIGKAGDRWIVIRRARSVPCLNGPGVLIIPENDKYKDFIRWVPLEAIDAISKSENDQI